MLPIVAGLAAFGTKVGTIAVTYAPQILTAGGVASILVGGGLLIKDTPGYIEIWEELERGEKTKAEAAKAIIKKAAIPAGLIISGILWIGVGQKISLDRAAAAAFGTGMLTKEIDELKGWKHEAEKVLGEDKTKEVNKKVASRSKDTDPLGLDIESRKGILKSTRKDGGGPMVACYCIDSNQPFTIRFGGLTKAINEASGILYSELFLTKNQWLSCLGLPTVPGGDLVGIHADSVGNSGLQLKEGGSRMDWDGIHALRDVAIADYEWEPAYRVSR